MRKIKKNKKKDLKRSDKKLKKIDKDPKKSSNNTTKQQLIFLKFWIQTHLLESHLPNLLLKIFKNSISLTKFHKKINSQPKNKLYLSLKLISKKIKNNPNLYGLKHNKKSKKIKNNKLTNF